MILKKHKFAALLIAAVTVIGASAQAADTRPGRVIPLATRTCFGYSQVIGDRLCLFNDAGAQIGDYSAWSEVTSENNYMVIDDGQTMFFYDPSARCFLELPSGYAYEDSPFSSGTPAITVSRDGGYYAYLGNGEVYYISEEDVKAALPDKEILSVYYTSNLDNVYEDGYFSAVYQRDGGSRYATRVSPMSEEEAAERERFNAFYEKISAKGYSANGDTDGHGNYIISKPVAHSRDYGLADADGNILLQPCLSVIGEESEGMYVIANSQKNDRPMYAVSDKITSKADFIYGTVTSGYSQGLIGVEYSGFCGYIDKNREPVIDLTSYRSPSGSFMTYMCDFENGTAKLGLYNSSKNNSGTAYIDMEGNTLFDSAAYLGSLAEKKGSLYYVYTAFSDDLVVYLSDDEPPMQPHTIPADTGEPAQPYYNTDIRVMINGEPIAAYAVDGRMMIPVEDLMFHGFKIAYDNDLRSLFAYYTGEAAPIKGVSPEEVNTGASDIGSVAGNTVKSDISAYINGKYIETEAVDGKLLVEAEALCAPAAEDDPDYWMLRYLDLSPYLMRCAYDDSARTLYLYTYERD